MNRDPSKSEPETADASPGLDRLDTCGTFCPIPILLTARRMKTLSVGEQLEVVGDDPAIVEDMPVWCEETGNRLCEMERSGQVVRCVIEKAATPSLAPSGE